MDFINGCTTNVHVLDNFAATPFIHYTHTESHSNVARKTEDAKRAIAELRKSRALCTRDGQDIWLFAPDDHELGDKYTVAQEGIAEGQTAVIRLLLNAIESALSYTLAQEGLLTHIGRWTWIYSNRDADDGVEASILTLRVKEAPNGALYLFPKVNATSWTPIDQASDNVNDEILLAPCGRTALLAAESTESLAPDSQWKAHVIQALQAEGTTLPTDAGWIDVELVEDGVRQSCKWPSQLCLVRQCARLPGLEDSAGWQTWIDNGKTRTYRDPLVLAEEWFLGSVERKRRATEKAGKEEFQVDAYPTSHSATTNDMNFTTSPPFMQRTADHQAAMSGIYPTPPDGLAHHGQTQLSAQISLSATTPSVAQIGDAGAVSEIVDNAPEQAEDSLGLDTFAMDGVEEDLFGDVDGEMFEENEVGEADFDYFDEPDDVPTTGDMAGGDLQMMDEPALSAATNNQYAPESSEVGDIDVSHERQFDVELVSSPPSTVAIGNEVTNHASEKTVKETERRVLSPFGIRERLLPPPVPASFARASEDAGSHGRSSSFAPIAFRDGIDLGAKYAGMDITSDRAARNSGTGLSIALPPSRGHKDSDDETDETGSSECEFDEVELPPRLPWESTRKRKRSWEVAKSSPVGYEIAWAEEIGASIEDSGGNEQDRSLKINLLDLILNAPSETGVEAWHFRAGDQQQGGRSEDHDGGEMPNLKELYELSNADLICIAQLLGEQASSCLSTHPSPTTKGNYDLLPATLVIAALRNILPSRLEPCDLQRLALTRDPALATRTNLRAPAPLRSGSELPDVFPLPAPYIRIQRNNDIWEMLPPALSFWEPNGLAGASGQKNVKARAVFPKNNDLRGVMRGFMAALGRTYEGCKLGTHSYEVYDGGESDAAALVEEDGGSGSKAALLKGYARTCDMLGKELAAWCTGPGKEWEGTIVVYILDPFAGDRGKKYLCACFWTLFQSYIERLRAGNKRRGEDPVPDVVLQILPVDVVAGMDELIIPSSEKLASLAREVYDRCPSSSAVEEEGEGAAAPSILLAPPIPKRIAFQLMADVPAESLLQDGRVLHLAVAMSGDREWMSCVWSNGQGRTLTQESFCLRGEAVGSVVRQVWQRTGELVGRVRMIWRVFVVLDEGVWHGSGLDLVWRDVVTSCRIGGTTVCVTLVKLCAEMAVVIGGEAAIVDGAVGLATPASTPVALPTGAGATTGTNSPNIGASDGFGAPLTPAGSESTVNGAAAAMHVAENDPDAHLVEVEDESCGLLLKPQPAALLDLNGMANGTIVRKGEEDEGGRFLLGVSLCWTLQVKAQGTGAVEIGSLRQAEVTLREVLRMYRALSVLTRARGLYEGKGLLPVHLAVASKGARGLEGMLC